MGKCASKQALKVEQTTLPQPLTASPPSSPPAEVEAVASAAPATAPVSQVQCPFILGSTEPMETNVEVDLSAQDGPGSIGAKSPMVKETKECIELECSTFGPFPYCYPKVDSVTTLTDEGELEVHAQEDGPASTDANPPKPKEIKECIEFECSTFGPFPYCYPKVDSLKSRTDEGEMEIHVQDGPASTGANPTRPRETKECIEFECSTLGPFPYCYPKVDSVSSTTDEGEMKIHAQEGPGDTDAKPLKPKKTMECIEIECSTFGPFPYCYPKVDSLKSHADEGEVKIDAQEDIACKPDPPKPESPTPTPVPTAPTGWWRCPVPFSDANEVNVERAQVA